jgi:hypothetical protein
MAAREVVQEQQTYICAGLGKSSIALKRDSFVSRFRSDERSMRVIEMKHALYWKGDIGRERIGA